MSVGFLSSFHIVMGKPPFRTLSLKERSKETYRSSSFQKETNQRKFYIPQTPCYIAPGLNRKVAEAVDFPQVLVSRDDAMFFLMAGAWREYTEKKKNWEKVANIINCSYLCSANY